MPPAHSVSAGTAPIEQALSTIVPAAYRIALDDSVPSSAMVVWPAGDNWVTVLRAAVAPLDLVVSPDWEHNVVRVVHWRPATMPRMPASSGAYASAGGTYGPNGPASSMNAPQVMPVAASPASASVAASAGAGFQAMASRTSMVVDAPATAAAPADSGYTLPSGVLLSDALNTYVKRFGWTLKWSIHDDYRLDAPVPIPAMDVVDGVSYVVKAYQAQGGMKGVVPRFAKPNRVVVVEMMSVQERNQ